ncbi:MAG TPA: galactokinase family protein [Vicinamibacterales bacterium]
MRAADISARLSPGARHVFETSMGRAEAALASLGVGAEAYRFVPGRIEVLGKHTDYAGGRSFTCAAERGFAVVFSGSDTPQLRIVDARDGRNATIPLLPEIEPAVGHWTNYPMTVARRLARDFGPLRRGVDLAFCSTLPKSAGLSTSSALITAVFLALSEANDLPAHPTFRDAVPSPEALAGYLGSIENGAPFGPLSGDRGVGTTGGSEDHTAILLSRAGHLTCYRYTPVTALMRVELPGHLTFVVVASGIAAEKTGTARERYNRGAELVSDLVHLWNGASGRSDRTLHDALTSAPDALARLRALVTSVTDSGRRDALARRLEHYVLEEQQLLPAALAALDAGRIETFGVLVDRSQRAAEDLLGNQVPETVTLARLARELGAHAASAFGAGFGGSVWALVDADSAGTFLDTWLERYARAHPGAAPHASGFVTRPGPGALTRDRA